METSTEYQPKRIPKPATKDDRDNLPVKNCGSKDAQDAQPIRRKPYGQSR